MSLVFEIASSSNSINDVKKKQANQEEQFVSSFEKLLTLIRSDGPYQWRLLTLFMIPFSFFYGIAAMNFLLLLTTPDHTCHVPGMQETNLSLAEWKNLTIPWEKSNDGTLILSKCEMYKLYNESDTPLLENSTFEVDNSEQIKCQYGWDYDNSSWTETPVTKFDWVCDDSNKVTTLFTLYLSAAAIGTFSLSILSDRVGRLPMFYLTLILLSVFGPSMNFSQSFVIFASFKFLQSLAFYTLYQMPFLIVSELCSQRLRSFTTVSTFISFIVAVPVVSFFAWLLNDWKWFNLVTVLPVSLFLLYWRMVPESPRWLLSTGKTEKCEKILKDIAKVNKTQYTQEMKILLIQAEEEEKHKVSPLKLFSSYVMTKHLILVCLLCSASFSHGMSITLNINNMKGNTIVIYFLLGLFELPGNILGSISSDYIGRRSTVILCSIFSTAFAAAASFYVSDFWTLVITCGLSKMFNGGVVLAVYHQTGELFPTSLRATAYGITGVTGMAATVAVPKLMALGAGNAHIPYYILTCMGIITIVVASFLPETLGSALPQTIKEANLVGKDQSFFTIIHKWNAHKYYAVQKNNPDDSETDLNSKQNEKLKNKALELGD